MPLDPSNPIDRTKAIVSSVNARFVLTSPTYRSTFEKSEAKTVVVDDSLNHKGSMSSMPSVDVSPQSPAFVLFTSGSTGQPKGVVQAHASVCTISKAYGETLHVDHNSRVLQFARYVIRCRILCTYVKTEAYVTEETIMSGIPARILTRHVSLHFGLYSRWIKGDSD